MRGVRRRIHGLVTTLIALGLFIGGGLMLWAASVPTPDLSSLETRKIAQSTKFYDRTGTVLLYDLHSNVKRTVVPLSDIAPDIRNATVAIEDDTFYEHHGVRPLAFLRAVMVNIFSLGFSQGGSTITQQVVKNSVLTKEKTITRKLKEWILAIKVDRALTKERILELYLNETPYGGSLYGVEAASEAFFGKPASEVTLPEAAYLAALPQAPTYYSPYGNHRDDLERRKNLVLDRMLINGFITDEAHAAAINTSVEFIPSADVGIKAPHFVFYVREYLAEKYGENALLERGFKVTTTLDYRLQQEAETIVAEAAKENTEKYNASNAGLVAINPQTGEILAMVGSRNYFDADIDGNFNIALANRQPGSAFKPFVYAAALEKGYTPETVVFDVPTQFQTTCAIDDFSKEGDCYAPTNYDDTFKGPVTLRDALAQSINIPAIKVLYLTGITRALELAKSMGISTLTDAERYGLTLVLGGGEVSLLEMTSAYGVFASEGLRNDPAAVISIEDQSGVVVERREYRPGGRVLPEAVAREINDMLSDNVARTPAFGSASALYFPGRQVAAKTGTTNDYRDAWIIGYTPSLAVGAWAGNNDNTPMEKRVAGFIVAPLWHAFMEKALADSAPESFTEPDYAYLKEQKPVLRGIWQGGTTYTLDTLSGKLATEYTPEALREERAVRSVHSILHWVDKNNPRGAIPVRPENDPQYDRWEYSVRAWANTHGFFDETEAVIPTATDDVHLPGRLPLVKIISPEPGAAYARNAKLALSVTTAGYYPPERVEYYLNGLLLGIARKNPYTLSFIPNDIETANAQNTLTAVLYDSVGNRNETSVSFLLR